MGMFDSQTDAALTVLNYEELGTTPGGEFAELIGDILKLIGTHGPLGIAGGASNLLQKVRKLAGAGYASNLVFVITAVRNDLKALSDEHEDLRGRIASLGTDAQFAEAVSALALRAMHTSVRDRLKRLARVLINGVKEDDLELESLDDMMRAAVELNASDIRLLGDIYERQINLLRAFGSDFSAYTKQITHLYTTQPESRIDLTKFMGSVAKLQAVAFVQLRTPGFDSGANILALLPDGAKFYERLQEIGAAK
jgi:hypothetical protein